MQASKSKNFKIVMSVMIPLLIIVTTVVMVGASFAWFTNADKVTVAEITMSTADSYRIDFTRQPLSTDGKLLFDNMQYVGQTAFCASGANAGKLMTEAIAAGNAVDTSDRAYYFINTVALDTQGKTFDMSMAFDGVKIVKYKRNADGSIAKDENEQNVVEKINKIYAATGSNVSPVSDIPFAFTWFFKAHGETDNDGVVRNYETYKIDDSTNAQRLLQLEPQKNEVWYTPYGKLTFGDDNLVARVNDDDSIDSASIKGVDKRIINDFGTNGIGNATSQLFDFYIVFAPEKLFWMQFFSADRDKYTATDIYTTTVDGETTNDDTKKIFEELSNQMYYSHMDYSGSTFEFSAVLNVTNVHEEAQG
ncbi:MAG TPA: hypothetical protein DCS37_03200 [Clostridiales bacterium]|nr:hypothetical protein [Clostridiales bacterium]